MSEAITSIPLTLSQASGVPFYRQIVDQVSELIRGGSLAPEAQLPSVRALALQLMVSLITVRRAYADLEAAGLIVRRQGHGTFVAGEVEVASREKSLTEARSALGRAIEKARRLGLDGDTLREVIDELLASEEGDGNGAR